MVDLEKQNIPGKKSDSFLNSISNALLRLKQKLQPPKSPDIKKELFAYNKPQELNRELSDLQNQVLATKANPETQSELSSLHKDLVLNKKVSWSKNIPFPYTPNHPDTINWLQKNQDRRIAAPWIAKSADDLRDTIKWSSLLTYFLG